MNKDVAEYTAEVVQAHIEIQVNPGLRKARPRILVVPEPDRSNQYQVVVSDAPPLSQRYYRTWEDVVYNATMVLFVVLIVMVVAWVIHG